MLPPVKPFNEPGVGDYDQLVIEAGSLGAY
jgi:hypothetical protein